MVVLVTCKNDEDPIKNEGTRVVTILFIDFSDTQGQLIPKSVIESCQNSNSSKLLWQGSLPARMKKIHPKMTALEWSHIQAFMVGLVTCKNEEDPSKNDCTRVVTIFLPL